MHTPVKRRWGLRKHSPIRVLAAVPRSGWGVVGIVLLFFFARAVVASRRGGIGDG